MYKITICHLTGALKGEREAYSTARHPCISIGRSADCDVKVEDPHCVVSRVHARLECDDEMNVMITDLDSANGTFLNGQFVDRPSRLVDGDEIQLGVKVGPVIRVGISEAPANDREAILGRDQGAKSSRSEGPRQNDRGTSRRTRILFRRD